MPMMAIGRIRLAASVVIPMPTSTRAKKITPPPSADLVRTLVEALISVRRIVSQGRKQPMAAMTAPAIISAPPIGVAGRGGLAATTTEGGAPYPGAG